MVVALIQWRLKDESHKCLRTSRREEQRLQERMRMPGVEPGSQAWEACMMPLHYMRPCRDPQVRRRLCKGGGRQDYELHLGDTQERVGRARRL